MIKPIDDIIQVGAFIGLEDVFEVLPQEHAYLEPEAAYTYTYEYYENGEIKSRVSFFGEPLESIHTIRLLT